MTDIKEVSKRTYQLAYVCVGVCFVTLLLYLFYSLYLSALLVGLLLVFTLIGIWFNNRGYEKYTKPIILTTIMLFVLLLAFAEGLAAGGYLYFIPILFALPLLTESNKPYKKELIFYFIVDCSAFCCCILFCPEKSSWQHISDETYKSMFHLNTTGTLTVAIIFVYFSFYFEKKYAAALFDQIAKAENAMHTRTAFLSNMGHELRTPLNGISGIIGLLKKEELTPGQQEYLNLLKYCSDQMLGLVNDVLDFNKIEAGKLELHPIVFNVKQLLNQAVQPFYYRFEQKNVALKVQIDNSLDENIMADDLRLVQVINNLLSNALKFTESGQVKLMAETLQRDYKTIGVRFTVQDSGIGIDARYQKKIFESFGQVINENTRKQQGAGLGLTISQRLLELMGSTLEVTSEPGQGSTFFFTCAFERVSTASVPVEIEKENEYDLEGMQILVVEDNPINLMIISKLLKDWKAQINTAVNGKLGMDSLAENHAYDLILLDLQMPEMDGYEAIIEIKKLYPRIPVLAFTASLVDDLMKNELLNLGFDGYITKPFKAQELYKKIQKFCTPLPAHANP
ncbi:MAG: response regulator [Segetibacter sp.]|nr:response regulator [Segetibacter sp.]